MAKTRQKTEARHLRSEGKSIKEIARDLAVSTSTASLWCRDIKLTPEQISQLEKNSRDPYYGRRLSYALKQQAYRLTKEKLIRSEAKNMLINLSAREKLLAGTALYWAEGFKKDKMAGFANSDPEMINFIIEWLINSLSVSKDLIRLRVGINESHSHRVEEIEKYWSEITSIPNTQFYKPFFQKTSWKKTYDHPENYFGTLRIRILKSTDLLRKIKGLIMAVKYN
ncbi:MAG: hypothetical protein UX91_C0007G0088 [Candidatus Amesbacteria bacterium GW2011_GWB1_47_19]|nr:MAG: hypothetical protein UW51_C0006G0091 [Candidatus Amesbacteria bacterium GW2011_GWA1_44_24]KKU31872.1 MAG: hypothetical protein UX46_C0002G0088 [Candidatus Amesbacteria bacterium GW2011_GWC1_46_24]KKU66808.1 MAG: hypothetical protein UX91_C0007G0088 [Candidatus Amesbacteria bacterium GW2011_GWB1_47_19]OGD05288.1 MAG: hypothetical protein A2379_03760 [Candidatus Amesbacteria bacterium RIFOXYB1_FULL_47_13]HBC73170.1 hypothetical protein [Candidatus Amesbacteria bacterium]